MVKSRPAKSAASIRSPGTFGRWSVKKDKLLDVVMAEEAPLEVEITDKPAFASATEPHRRERHRLQGNSPDGKWLAFIRENNVWVKNLENGEECPLSKEGTPEDGYGDQFFWSPNSKKVVAVRTKKGQERKVYFIESSPPDQIQPRLHSHNYLKPGDRIDQDKPQLFDLATKKRIEVQRRAVLPIRGASPTSAGRPIPAASRSSTTSAGIK